MISMTPKDRIMVALDVDSLSEAQRLTDMLAPYVGCFKVGLQLLTKEGAPAVVKAISECGGEVFFDGKFDDIPNTVAAASRATASLGVKYFDVHACCGQEALKAAVSARGTAKVLVDTVLTSLDEATAQSIFGASAKDKVLQFARSARDAQADGIVCSAKDLEWIRTDPSLETLLKVTPGIRPDWSIAQDQKRTLSPKAALKAGATHLVIGRPILQPPPKVGSPVEAAKKILEEIAEGSP